MTTSMLFSIAGVIALVGAVISSICWICLLFTWWRMEKRRVKRIKEKDNLGIL